MNIRVEVNILSKNLMVDILSLLLETPSFWKPQLQYNILCFETDQILFSLNSGKGGAIFRERII